MAIDPKVRQQILDAYTAGDLVLDIAKKYGVAQATVTNSAKKAGLPMRGRKVYQKSRALTEEMVLQAKALYLQGVPWKQILRDVGDVCSTRTYMTHVWASVKADRAAEGEPVALTPVRNKPVDTRPRLSLPLSVNRALFPVIEVEPWSLREAMLSASLAAAIHGTDKAVKMAAFRALPSVHKEAYGGIGLLINCSSPMQLLEIFLNDPEVI